MNETTTPVFNHWTITFDQDNIAWVGIDNKDSNQNVLSSDVIEEFGLIVDTLRAKAPTGAIIYSAKKNGFIAGADINEFKALTSADQALSLVERAHSILNDLESLSFPTVAMIDGVALGGGLELALACKYIVLSDSDSTKIGLPEVNLGIHPGFGGSVRMIERIGPIDAMTNMLQGRILSARSAGKSGLVDRVAPQRQLKRMAVMLIKQQPPRQELSTTEKIANSTLGRKYAANKMREQVAERAAEKNYPAPYRLIDLWQEYGGDRTQMLREEARSISKLFPTVTSHNLVRCFFLQETLKGLGKTDIPANIHHVHVIGAGVMGGDIAAWCALRGLTVTISDTRAEALGAMSKRAYALFEKKLRDPRLVQHAMDRLTTDLYGIGVTKADLIIEAIVENADIKKKVFQQIEANAKPDAILASNTSSIPLETIAGALLNPARLIGVHFFNPVAKMQLVEIVKSSQSDENIVKRALGFTKAIGKLPVPVKSSPGFLVNRILMPYLMEAVHLLEEGVPAKTIDDAALDFGMPMGPIELADVVGLDICLNVGETLTSHLGGEVPQLLRQKVDKGELGRKSGSGFYTWKDGKAEKQSKESTYSQEMIIDRLTLRYINESVACLREGVTDNKDWLDASMIFGTGFAPFRGGPLQYVKQYGTQKLHDKLHGYESSIGERFKPDEGWAALLNDDSFTSTLR